MKYDALKKHYTAQAEQVLQRYPNQDSPQHRRALGLLALLPITESHHEAADLYAWMVYGQMAAIGELARVNMLVRRYAALSWSV